MFFLKFAAGILAVITVSFFAKTKCKKMRAEYEFFNALNEYLKSVKSAAGYKKAKISEISVENADFKEFLGNFPVTGKLSDLTAPEYLTEAEKLKIATLFSFIVSADALRVTLLTDGIDLINKYDTWCFFSGLFEQITNFGCTTSDKHFNKFTTRNREERNPGFTSYSFS